MPTYNATTNVTTVENHGKTCSLRCRWLKMEFDHGFYCVLFATGLAFDDYCVDRCMSCWKQTEKQE